MNLERLEIEGAEDLTREELETLDGFGDVSHLYRAMDSSIGKGSVVGDNVIRKAFAIAVRAIREKIRKRYRRQHADDLESELMMRAFDIIVNWTQSNRPRTPSAYRAYITAGINNRLAKTGKKLAKETESRLEVELFDVAEQKSDQPWDDGELIALFADYFRRLYEPDQLLVTPLPFVGVPIEQWPHRTAADILDRFAEDTERINQLSDRWGVHPGEVHKRLQNLLCLFKDFKRKGDDAFTHYNSGPSWLNETRTGPKRKPVGTGTRHTGPRDGGDGDNNVPRTKRPRRRDHTKWGCEIHKRINSAAKGVSQ